MAIGTKLEHIIAQLAYDVASRHAAIEGDLVVKPSDEHFWFGRPRIVLHLIHFILFQNAFELSFFFWILVSKATTANDTPFPNSGQLRCHETEHTQHRVMAFIFQMTYGLESCFMDHVGFLVPRLVLG
jgi:mlo protein